MRRPRIKDCHLVALELMRVSTRIHEQSSITGDELARAERCERMAAWLRELANEMADQLRRVEERNQNLPRRTPLMRIPR
jgi:hypothetical protein